MCKDLQHVTLLIAFIAVAEGVAGEADLALHPTSYHTAGGGHGAAAGMRRHRADAMDWEGEDGEGGSGDDDDDDELYRPEPRAPWAGRGGRRGGFKRQRHGGLAAGDDRVSQNQGGKTR